MNVYEGSLVSQGIKVGIVAARFNEFIVSKLVSGALDGLNMMLRTKTLMLHGFPVHLKFRLLHQKWLIRENMTQLYVLVL